MGGLAPPFTAVLLIWSCLFCVSRLVSATGPSYMIMEEVQQVAKQQAAAAGEPDYQGGALPAHPPN
jgi:hypothetical protein